MFSQNFSLLDNYFVGHTKTTAYCIEFGINFVKTTDIFKLPESKIETPYMIRNCITCLAASIVVKLLQERELWKCLGVGGRIIFEWFLKK